MKSALRAAVAALACGAMFVVATTEAEAQFPNGTVVSETVHNFSLSAVSPMPHVDYGEVCVYCHTPHGGTATAPLWNRDDPVGPWTMYDSPSIDMTIEASPMGVSLACLSCHDGTIAIDVIINPPNSYTGPDPDGSATIDECAGCHTGNNPPGGLDFTYVNLTTDLSDDHPISVNYDPTADPDFNPAADVEAAGLPLPNGQVQCNSCHNPHSAQFRPFLRIDNAASAMCNTCHIK